MINQPNSVDQPILTNQEKMVKGSAWMTASNIISRMLGAIYIIPWYAWMGEHGNEAEQFVFNGVYDLCLIPNDLYRRNSRCDCQADLAL